MAQVIVNVLVKSVGVYFKASNIYLSAETQETIRTEKTVYEGAGAQISIIIPKNEANLVKVSQLITCNWKIATIELDLNSRTKADEKFGKQIYRYTANCIELPQVCEPLMLKS